MIVRLVAASIVLLSLTGRLDSAVADEELLQAVKDNDYKHVLRHLDELSKDPNHVDPWRKSVLMYCGYYCGDHRIAKLLIERGAEVNHVSDGGRTPLIAAAFTGRPEIVKLLIDAGAELNVQDKRHGFTALHHAMNEIHHAHDAKHEEVIRMLIDAGADMHIQGKYGHTVEHIAEGKKLHHIKLHTHVKSHAERTRPSDDEPREEL